MGMEMFILSPQAAWQSLRELKTWASHFFEKAVFLPHIMEQT